MSPSDVEIISSRLHRLLLPRSLFTPSGTPRLYNMIPVARRMHGGPHEVARIVAYLILANIERQPPPSSKWLKKRRVKITEAKKQDRETSLPHPRLERSNCISHSCAQYVDGRRS